MVYVDFYDKYLLEIYPIRNWYDWNSRMDRRSPGLEIYPIRNWYGKDWVRH